MIKILFIIPALGNGGAERTAQLLLNNINRKKFKVYLVVFKDFDKNSYLILEDIPVIVIKKRNRWDFFKLVLKISSLLKEIKPDIVVGFIDYANIISVLARKISGWNGKIVLTEHSNPQITLPHKKFQKLKKWFIKIIYSSSDFTVTVSKGMKKSMENYLGLNGDKIKVIYNSIDINSIKKMTKEIPSHSWFKEKKFPILISIGRLTKQKAYIDLLRAFTTVKKNILCKLIIIGVGEDLENLRNLSKRLEISEDVDFIGFQKNPFAFISYSDVFILSSHWETFGIVLIEAMACGIPVISTRCPYGPEEIIIDRVNGLLVPVGNIKIMSEAISRLLDDRELRDYLAEGGMKRAKDFGVEKMVKEYEKCFSEVFPKQRSLKE